MHGSMGGERKPGVSRRRRATPGASRLPDHSPVGKVAAWSREREARSRPRIVLAGRVRQRRRSCAYREGEAIGILTLDGLVVDGSAGSWVMVGIVMEAWA